MGSSSEEEAQNFPSEMLPPGLLVIHDAPGGGEDHVAELSGGQQVVGPLLYFSNGDIESGRDHTTLVQTAGQIDNNLALG